MSLEDIFGTLDAEGKKEREQVLKTAEQEAKRILDLANEDAGKVKQKELERVTLALKGEKAKILNQAELFKKEEIIKAKEKVIAQAFENAKVHIESLRKKEIYERVFENLAREAFTRVKGDVVVSVDKQDEAVARKALDKLGKGYKLSADINCLGGLVVKTANERATYLNTIDARMEKARQVLKSEIAEALFGS